APSKAIHMGPFPTGKVVVRFASYQCRMAIWDGFLVEWVTPISGADCAQVRADSNNRGRILRAAGRIDLSTTHLPYDPRLEIRSQTSNTVLVSRKHNHHNHK